jgi:hypothetical protein
MLPFMVMLLLAERRVITASPGAQKELDARELVAR